MKKITIKNQILIFVVLVWGSLSGIAQQTFQPINVNTTPTSSSCSANGGAFSISAPSEVLSGQNIPLNISLPGTLDPSCDVSITINYNSPNNKIYFVASSNIAFAPGSNSLTTTNSLPGNDGQNFNVFFKFPNNMTCDGETATFNVTFDACGTTCTTEIAVKARAANYWTVKKEFVIGNLTCGISKWRFSVLNNNPNPSGYGNYKIVGTLTENAPVPVLSGAVLNVNRSNSLYNQNVFLQNCQNEDTTITNAIDYYFNLGDGCGVMEGTATAVSDTLQSPNASLSFIKGVGSTSGKYVNNILNLSAGCQGFYRISVTNDGNTPWQINSITDIVPSNLTITSSYSTWVNPPTISGSTYTFTPNTVPFILNPGEYKYIDLGFTVNSSVPNGAIITNTAHINYNGASTSSSGGGQGQQCQGVTCPSIDQQIANDSASVKLKVLEPFPMERFYKCITDGPPAGIYNIGDAIHFKYIVKNSGSGDLNTTITDNMALPNQNLQIIPSSITTSFFENNGWTNSNNVCNYPFTNQQPVSFGVVPDFSNLQDPSFTINNMPGICELYRANYLVIEFDAELLPQIYGNKINTAYTDIHQNSVGYTIDQIGVLEVSKRADQEFVENGGSFNYILEVTNSGSVPLDHVSVQDQLPSCVQIQQGVQASDFSGVAIPVTTSGNLSVNLDPSWQLMPGQTATITVPVTKQGGGNCCNETVTAQGTMTTSGIVLEANNGSADEPAACVKSTECCDIPDFEAHLYENNNGSYSVMINGGAVPLQQVDISVIDYHVEYSQRECKPQDMGAFGTLSTQAQHIDGLLLNAASNNTSNLSWEAGTASIINSSVNFDISKPNVLNLDCCKVDFYFCVKVTVKDVNCNVCEKVVCIEKKPEPCEIKVNNVKNSYCTNDAVNISWNGSTPSGLVNVYAIPASGGGAILLAGNQPDTGSFMWNIPSTIKPCDSQWNIVIANVDHPDACFDRSNTFIIKCCETTCECGDWKTDHMNISEVIHGEPHPDMEKFSTNLKCGEKVKLSKNHSYQFTAPLYTCDPDNCDAEFKWAIQNSAGQNIQGSGNSFNYTFNQLGDYEVIFTPICGGKKCKSCSVMVSINKGVIIDLHQINQGKNR